MYAFSIFSTKDSDYKYNDFITDLKAGNVSEVTIRQNNEVPSGSIVVVLSKDKSRKVVYVTDVNKVISDIDEIDTDVKPTVTDVAGDNSLMISIIQVLLMAGVVIVIIITAAAVDRLAKRLADQLAGQSVVDSPVDWLAALDRSVAGRLPAAQSTAVDQSAAAHWAAVDHFARSFRSREFGGSSQRIPFFLRATSSLRPHIHTSRSSSISTSFSL